MRAGGVGAAHRLVLVVLYEIVHEARLLELRLRARSSTRLISLFLLVLEYSKAILDLWALILVITEAQLGLIIVHHVLTSALKGALRALPQLVETKTLERFVLYYIYVEVCVSCLGATPVVLLVYQDAGQLLILIIII